MCNFFIFEKSVTYEKKCVKILFASVFHGFFSLSIFFMKIEFKRFTIEWKFYLILVIFLLGLILLLLKLRWKKFIKKWKNSEKGFYQIKCSVSVLLLPNILSPLIFTSSSLFSIQIQTNIFMSWIKTIMLTSRSDNIPLI